LFDIGRKGEGQQSEGNGKRIMGEYAGGRIWAMKNIVKGVVEEQKEGGEGVGGEEGGEKRKRRKERSEWGK